MNLTLLSFKSNRKERKKGNFTFSHFKSDQFYLQPENWRNLKTCSNDDPVSNIFPSPFHSQITSNVSNLFRNNIIAYAFRTSTISYCQIVRLQKIISTLFFFESHATFLLKLITLNQKLSSSTLDAFITENNDWGQFIIRRNKAVSCASSSSIRLSTPLC